MPVFFRFYFKYYVFRENMLACKEILFSISAILCIAWHHMHALGVCRICSSFSIAAYSNYSSVS